VIPSPKSEVDVVAGEDVSMGVVLKFAPSIFAVVQFSDFVGVIVHDENDRVTGLSVESLVVVLRNVDHLSRSFRRRCGRALGREHRSDSCDQGKEHLIYHVLIISKHGAPCNPSRVPTRS